VCSDDDALLIFPFTSKSNLCDPYLYAQAHPLNDDFDAISSFHPLPHMPKVSSHIPAAASASAPYSNTNLPNVLKRNQVYFFRIFVSPPRDK